MLPAYPGRRVELDRTERWLCGALVSSSINHTERVCVHRFSKGVLAVTGKAVEVSV